MKILFVSPDFEEKARGIGVVLKNMMMSAHDGGHEVGMLVGYPESKIFDESPALRNKIEHMHLQHYLREGRKSFRYMIRGGYHKINVLRALLNGSLFKIRAYNIDRGLVAGDSELLKSTDFVVKSPYFYQFLTRNWSWFVRRALPKITRKLDIDLVIVASPSILRRQDTGQAKLAHFIHDLMPIELVETPPDRNTPNKFARQFYGAVTESDLLFANSKDTESKIREVKPDANVQVTYIAASSRPEDLETSHIVETYRMKPRQYLLFIASIERRKNVERLLDAYARVADKINMPLVIVGGGGYGFREIAAKYSSLGEAKKRVYFMGYVSEADKYGLYRDAFAYILPAIYEGFGIMIVEAMSNDVPVITVRRGAMLEAGGDAALYIDDPYSSKEIADRILELYEHPERRAEMIKRGHKMAANFTYDKFKQRFNDGLKRLEKN